MQRTMPRFKIYIYICVCIPSGIIGKRKGNLIEFFHSVLDD